MSGAPIAGGGPNNGQQEQLIGQFCAITGSQAERARFYLESARWNLELAMESFFENNEGAEIAAHLPQRQQQQGSVDVVPKIPPARNQQQQQQFAKTSPNRLGRLNPTNDSSDTDEDVKIVGERQPANMPKFSTKKKSPVPKKAAAPKKTTAERRFATLNDIKSQQSRDGDNSESDSGNESGPGGSTHKKDNRQAFFVGGSDRSGLEVLGPSKPKTGDLVARLFKEAKARGAVEVPADSNQHQPNAHQPTAFSGSGMRLGDAASGSTPILPPGAGDGANGATAANRPRPPVRVRVALWANGFTVDDGPLRSFDGPSNLEFLNSIKNGRIPAELYAKFRGATIDLDLERRIHEDYLPPKVSAQPFQGQGYTLGSVVPKVEGAGQPVPAQSSMPSDSSPAVVRVDPNSPATKIQIRLSNGQRLVVEFNVNHTVADIRRYVLNIDPSTTGFVFATGFPPKDLTDESQTIDQADLLNSIIVQKVRK